MLESEPDWSEADPSVIHTAEDLIRRHHRLLREARICFIFRKESQKVKGNRVHAGVAKISTKEQVILDYDYLVWVSKEWWEQKDDRERDALMDHQLCHMYFSDGNWTIVGHDLEEFTEVIERHGLWSGPLKATDTALAHYYVQQGLEFDKELARGKLGTVDQVTLSSAGKSVTMTGAQFEHAAETILNR